MLQHKEEPANQVHQMHHQAAPQLLPLPAEFSTPKKKKAKKRHNKFPFKILTSLMILSTFQNFLIFFFQLHEANKYLLLIGPIENVKFI